MRTTVITAACLFLLANAPAQQDKPKTSAVPSGKAVLEAYVSAWNRHDFAAFDKLLAPDAIHEDIAQGFRGQGLGEIKDFMRALLEGQPDLDWHLTTIVEADTHVAAEWTWTSTYTGDSPSGPVVRKRISGRGASVAVIENGRIKRFTDYYDIASYFPKTPAAKAPVPDDDLSAAKQQVLDLEKEWVAAEVKRDASTLRRILDDKFVASFGARKPYDKEAFIKQIVSGDADPTESQTLTDETVTIDHDTAVVVGTDTERGTDKGAAYTAVARYTVTYIRRHGQWLALAEHLVEVPQTK
ncbi:MAG TPA: nuclear transport factor 2 family protein [Candidatus Angelobacter sp.]|nr:nuclear transport factor 2 family protein [Candidatus Angelobacter sp.]